MISFWAVDPRVRISEFRGIFIRSPSVVLYAVVPCRKDINSFRGNGLRGWRPERAMDRIDRPRTSIDERMLSGRRAVVIV